MIWNINTVAFLQRYDLMRCKGSHIVAILLHQLFATIYSQSFTATNSIASYMLEQRCAFVQHEHQECNKTFVVGNDMQQHFPQYPIVKTFKVWETVRSKSVDGNAERKLVCA